MQPTEGPDRQRMTQHRSQPTIGCVFPGPQAVTMSQQRGPVTNAIAPWIERVYHAGLDHQLVPAPAVVVAAYPQHLDAGISQVRDRREHAKATARHGVTPGEPKIKQVAHDDQRAGSGRHGSQKGEQRTFSVGRGHPEMGVTDHVTRRGKHGRILTWRACHDKLGDAP